MKAFLKGKCLARASLERTRLRQRMRIRVLKEGDANTKYFHMKANGRRRKHLIPCITDGTHTVATVEDKLELAMGFFMELMGTPKERPRLINLDEIRLGAIDPDMAQALEAPFSAEEVKREVLGMPSDRAPGPDGFSGLFYQSCWDIIAQDFMEVTEQLHTSGFNSFEILNESILTLLPKKEGALHLRDFRPINLIHGAAKIFAKVLALRLPPLLPKIITQA